MLNERDTQSRENRLAAIEAGLNSYHGSPCKGCGLTLKYVKSSGCVECGKRRTANRSPNVERKWRTSEKGQHKLHQRVRGDKYKDMQRRWRQSPQGLAYKREEAMRRFCAIREQTPEMNQAENAEIRMYYETAVYLTATTGIAYHVDHITPISKGGMHHPDNLQILTAEENLAKRAKLPGVWKATKQKGDSPQ